MLKISFACLVGIILAVSVSSSFFPELPTPVFLWSGNNYFTAKTQYLESTTTNQITDFIVSIISQSNLKNPLQSLINNNEVPELVIVWITPNDALHSDSYKQIKPLIESSASSIIIPYNYHENSVPSASLITNVIRTGHKVIIAQDHFPAKTEDIVNVERIKLVNYLENDKEIFNNGKPDLLIVYSPADSVDFISEVDKKSKELSQGKYVAVLTSDFPIGHVTDTVTAVHSQVAVMQRDMWHFAQSEFWPVEVWEGLMVVILLIIMLIIGVGCTATVQTPQKWGTGNLVCQFTEIQDP